MISAACTSRRGHDTCKSSHRHPDFVISVRDFRFPRPRVMPRFHSMTHTVIDPLTLPDAHGHFGQYGGMFVPETLMYALRELTAEYERAKADPAFHAELDRFHGVL